MAFQIRNPGTTTNKPKYATGQKSGSNSRTETTRAGSYLIQEINGKEYKTFIGTPGHEVKIYSGSKSTGATPLTNTQAEAASPGKTQPAPSYENVSQARNEAINRAANKGQALTERQRADFLKQYERQQGPIKIYVENPKNLNDNLKAAGIGNAAELLSRIKKGEVTIKDNQFLIKTAGEKKNTENQSSGGPYITRKPNPSETTPHKSQDLNIYFIDNPGATLGGQINSAANFQKGNSLIGYQTAIDKYNAELTAAAEAGGLIVLPYLASRVYFGAEKAARPYAQAIFKEATKPASVFNALTAPVRIGASPFITTAKGIWQIANNPDQLLKPINEIFGGISSGNVPQVVEAASELYTAGKIGEITTAPGIKGLQIIDNSIWQAQLKNIESARIDKTFNFETRHFNVNGPTDQFKVSNEQPPISAESLYKPTDLSIAAQRAIIKQYKGEIQRQIYPKDINQVSTPAEILSLDYFSQLKKPGANIGFIKESLNAQGQTTIEASQPGISVTPKQVIDLFRQEQKAGAETQSKLTARTESGQEVSLYSQDLTKGIYDFFKSLNPERTFKFNDLEINKGGKLPEQNIEAQNPYMDITKPPIFNYALSPSNRNINLNSPNIQNPTKINTETSNNYKPIDFSINNVFVENELNNKSIPAFNIKPKISQAQESSQAQQQESKQELKPIATQNNYNPFRQTIAPAKPKAPKKEINIYGGLSTKKEKTINGGFNVFLRSKGQFKKINLAPISAKQALNLGALKAEHTSAATFKINPAGSNKNVILGKVKDFYNKKGLYIEKNKIRINTPGELQEISNKGHQAKRFKSIFKNIFKKK